MPCVASQQIIDAAQANVVLYAANGLMTPRSDIVLEHLVQQDGGPQAEPTTDEEASQGDDRRAGALPGMARHSATFEATEGPLDRYQRTVTVEPVEDDQILITEQFDFQLAIPAWRVLFNIPFRRALCRGREWPWWHPPQRFNARQARVVALLAAMAVVYGFLGSLIGQTIAFAGDEFGASKSAKGLTLALIRLSILITVVVAAIGDRRGRRRTLLFATVGSIAAAAATALAANLTMLALFQATSRGLSHAMALLVLVFAMEEAPAGARAFVVSMLTMAAGLGSGLTVGFVPLADLGTSGWRLIFIMALLGLPLVATVSRHLPESLRFEAAQLRPRERPPSQHLSRFMLLAVTAFALQIFLAPASQLQNDFLHDERGFSATKIAIFTLLTTWTAGPGVLIAGKLADLRGRRVIAAVGASGGALFSLWHFTQVGWPMWVLIAMAALVGSATVPSLGVYRAELFGTTRRSESNGFLGVAAVAGSSAGLAAAGFMADVWGYGRAFSVLIAGPLIVAVLVLLFYPETNRRPLEDMNPEDTPPDSDDPPPPD